MFTTKLRFEKFSLLIIISLNCVGQLPRLWAKKEKDEHTLKRKAKWTILKSIKATSFQCDRFHLYLFACLSQHSQHRRHKTFLFNALNLSHVYNFLRRKSFYRVNICSLLWNLCGGHQVCVGGKLKKDTFKEREKETFFATRKSIQKFLMTHVKV